MHVTVGIPRERVAKAIGVSLGTLLKYYRTEIDAASADANVAVAAALFRKAINGDTSAMIFWMKARAGWHPPCR